MPDDMKSIPKPATAKEKATVKAARPKKRSANFDRMFTINSNAFESWAHSMSRLSQEMAQFMQTRLQEESAMWDKLAACRDPADLFACQSEFAAKTGTDYAEAAQKLSRLMLDFASSHVSDLLHTPTDTD